jgi:phospholipid transport system substrate-binding protein
MIRRRLFGLLLASFFATPFAGAADVAEAIEPIAELNRGLLEVMKAGPNTPFPTRFGTLAPKIERAFDLAGILRACVGSRWATLSPREQAGLADVFRQFTVASYVANFDRYVDEHFEVVPDSRPSPAGEIVETHIVSPTSSTIRIDYVMRQEGDRWRVVDVLLNGTISRVAVQRADFRGLLDGTADASDLITSLQQKVSDLSGGTLSAG